MLEFNIFLMHCISALDKARLAVIVNNEGPAKF